MKRRYFITGTGTSVGKTLITACLLAAMKRMGWRAIPVKPVQTGSETSDDLAWCLNHASMPQEYEGLKMLTMYRYAFPGSPHLAAMRVGETIDTGRILEALDQISLKWDVLLIEGAGGLLVPLNDRETMLDLMRASGARPLLVTTSTLGTLNHTSLTLHEMEREHIPAKVIIINDAHPPLDEEERIIRDDNIKWITRKAYPIPVISTPYLNDFLPDTLATVGGKMMSAVAHPDD